MNNTKTDTHSRLIQASRNLATAYDNLVLSTPEDEIVAAEVKLAKYAVELAAEKVTNILRRF